MSPYLWEKNSATFRTIPTEEWPEGQGAGSIITSVNDFVTRIKALIKQEDPINERIYQGLVRLRGITNPGGRRLKPHTSLTFYAAGLEVYHYRGHMVVGHDGLTSGFASRFFFLPDVIFGAVIAGNAEGPIATTLARDFIDDVLQIPNSDRQYLQQQKEDQGKSGESETESGKLMQAQKRSLDAYIGKYFNPGYHTLVVEIKHEKLLVDASNRSAAFTLTFDHVRDHAKYTARLYDVIDGGEDMIEAEFVFEDERVVKVGICLEPALKNLIWFDKVATGP